MTKKKSKSKNKAKSILFTIILAAIVVAIFAYLISTDGNILPEQETTTPAATVNGEEISQAELDELKKQLNTFLEKDGLEKVSLNLLPQYSLPEKLMED